MEQLALTNPVRLVVSDIEGCISAGKGLPLDLGSLRELQEHNRRARTQAPLPLTLCTGRSQPFVEAFCQMLAVFMPCVCENGALLYDPAQDMSFCNPMITERHMEGQRELMRTLERETSKDYPHRREPGKEICISLNPDTSKEHYAEEIPRLFEQIKKLVDPHLFTVTHSASAVDITPSGIDKASGVRFLAEVVGIPLNEMIGIGDTAGDLPFLSITGLSAAPSNSSPAVRQVVHYVSDKPATMGVLDILAWVNERNEEARKKG